jgi:hypothetical protein
VSSKWTGALGFLTFLALLGAIFGGGAGPAKASLGSRPATAVYAKTGAATQVADAKASCGEPATGAGEGGTNSGEGPE